jgi:hypothetical protein
MEETPDRQDERPLPPDVRAALQDAFDLYRHEIENDEPINGADFLDAFLEWREKYEYLLARVEGDR